MEKNLEESTESKRRLGGVSSGRCIGGSGRCLNDYHEFASELSCGDGHELLDAFEIQLEVFDDDEATTLEPELAFALALLAQLRLVSCPGVLHQLF